MIVVFLIFFMKSYVVYIVDKILICNHSSSFYEKEISDSDFCMPFLLGDRFKKDSLESAGKKQLTVTYCEGNVREDKETFQKD